MMRLQLRRIWKTLSIIIIICIISSSFNVHKAIYLKILDLSVGPPDILKEVGDSRIVHNDKNPPTIYHNYSQLITNKDIETFHAELPPLLKQYKNPCWLEVVSKDFNYKNSYFSHCGKQPAEAKQFAHMQKVLKERCQGPGPCWRMRCFPYFMSIGMQKAGTTALFHALTEYLPQIFNLPRKESHFWPRYRHGIGAIHCHKGRKMAFADYLDSYDFQSEEIRTTALGIVHGQIIGDYTPANAWFQHGWKKWPGNENQNEPRVILPHHIYHVYPHTKFIMNIRDPVSRYISNHYHDGNSASTLESGAVKAIKHFDKCTNEHPVRYCVYSIGDALCRGLYYVFVKDWMDLFPRKQFHFILFDEFTEDPAKVLIEISDFLQLDPPTESAVKELRSLPPENKTHTHKLTTTTVKLLQDFYRPWNKKLATQLQDDRYLWPY